MPCLNLTARRLAAGLLMALCAVAACASGLRINQVADQAPDLAVFLSGLPAPGAGAPTATAASAALAGTPLRVKSLVPWDPASAVAIVVAVDVSASMERDFEALKRALGGLAGRLPAGSQVSLMTIGAQVSPAQPFGLVPPWLTALSGLKADAPETALYEAIIAAQQAAGTGGPALPLRRLVLVVTDAMDDSKRGFSSEEVLRQISEGDAPVLALAVAPDVPPRVQRESMKALASIARASGGAFMQSTVARASQNLDLLLADGLRTQLLTLDCTACPRDGVVRSLQVSVQMAGGAPTNARAVRLLAPRPGAAGGNASGPAVGASATASGASGAVPMPGPVPTPFGSGVWAAAAAAGVALIGGLLLWLRKRRADAAQAAAQAATDAATAQAVAAAAAQGARAPLPPAAGGTPAVMPAAPPRDARPVTLDIDGQGRMELRVGSQEVVIGRGKAADVAVQDDAEASSRHAVLYRAHGVLMLRDLGSANGTWLNGTRILKPEPVNDRDVVRVGRTEVRVYLDAGRKGGST